MQMCHNLGARVVGTVSTEEKAKLAREAGADDVILYTQSDFETDTKRLTDSKGVNAVFDSVGKTTFEKGLNILKPRGIMVLFGGSSGAVPPFDPIALSAKGSLFLTRPTLGHYTATRDELEFRADAVFGMIAAGKLKLRIEHTYPLAQAQQAHRDLEGRKTTGKLICLSKTLNPPSGVEMLRLEEETLKRLIIFVLAVVSVLSAQQQYTRGVGLYPGDPKEFQGPVMKVDDPTTIWHCTVLCINQVPTITTLQRNL